MKRYYSLILVSLCMIVEAQAMPVAPNGLAPAAALSIPVASGCGLGVRRGPYDGCYPVYGHYAGYFRGYRNAYYTGPVSRGVCGGRGTHLACNFFGICWVACNEMHQ
jgi:hypothetical protein